MKSDNGELRAQLSQKAQKILQLENEISSMLESLTGSFSKKDKQQEPIGTADVHFYVQRQSNMGSVTDVIPFEWGACQNSI